MSLVDWYRYKADQCARLAKEATDPRKRASYNEEQKLWLKLVAETEREKPGQHKWH